MKKRPVYRILDDYEVSESSCFGGEAYLAMDMNEAIEKAEALIQKNPRSSFYISEIVKEVSPVVQPVEVEVKDI